jgi:predicted O-methyltransferase YrrM
MNLLDLTEAWTDIRGHLPLLYAIARFLPVRLGLEIGVRDGNSTLAILMGLAAQEDPGTLISVDPDECAKAKERILGTILARHWIFRQQRSAACRHSDLTLSGPIDLLLIDGSHDLADVNADWLLWGPLVRNGGLILFHDTETYDGPREVVARIPRGPDLFEVCTLPYDHGMTIARKRCDYWFEGDFYKTWKPIGASDGN